MHKKHKTLLHDKAVTLDNQSSTRQYPGQDLSCVFSTESISYRKDKVIGRTRSQVIAP